MEIALLLAIVIILAILILNRSGTLAIVSLVKSPHAFETWFNYHKKIMGVDRFYIFMDDDRENLGLSDPSLILIKNWKDRLGYQFNSKIDEPANVRVRQDLIVREGMRMAEADNIKYIVHIDSDELLYGPRPAAKTFARYSAGAFHMKNSEMAPDRKDYKNCFLEGTYFHKDPSKFIAYGNGKAGGVVGKSEPRGPHRFESKFSGVVEIPEEDLKILHYPSCNIEETMKRAKNYGNFEDDSARWSEHHKETRDLLANCDQNCRDKAEAQFEKRMAGPGAYKIHVLSGTDNSEVTFN
jgi:hypothetical protein